MKKKFLLIVIMISLVITFRVIFLNINHNYTIKESIIEGSTAPRGRILDAKGNVLVDNIGVKSIIYNKLNISTTEEIKIAKSLSNILDINPNIDDYHKRYYYYINNEKEINSELNNDIIKKYEERKITSKELLDYKLNLITEVELNSIDEEEASIYYLMNNGYDYEDKIIKLDISNDEYLKINRASLNGIRTDITWERYYPYGSTLKDVLGLVSSQETGLPIELKEEYLSKGYALNDRVGISNLEYIYDDYLKGTKAKYKIENNKLTKISDYIKGHDIVINIDIELQQKIEKVLEKEMINAKNAINTKYYNSSYIIVSDPNDGDVIALIGKKINDNTTFADYSYNNIISSFTVGSVVKGGTISVGYKYNLIDENIKVTDSCVTLKNQKPKCSWKNLGRLNDIEALRMSSNYFQYLIAIGLTGNKYHSGINLGATENHFNIYRDILKSYGLGNITGIDLLNESTGMKGHTISDDLLLNMAIGQYDTYTPIELSQYINTIATGQRTKLKLLKYVLSNDGTIYYENKTKVYNKVPIDNKYLNRIREGFKAVNKTGLGYSYTSHKFSSAGKTGTSESFLDTNMDGKIDKQTITTSYVMYMPYENPKYSIIMVSPHIKYQNENSDYKYPINMKVMKQISDMVYYN